MNTYFSSASLPPWNTLGAAGDNAVRGAAANFMMIQLKSLVFFFLKGLQDVHNKRWIREKKLSSHARDFKGLNWDELLFVLRPYTAVPVNCYPRTIIGPITRPSTLSGNSFWLKLLAAAPFSAIETVTNFLGPLNPKNCAASASGWAPPASKFNEGKTAKFGPWMCPY